MALKNLLALCLCLGLVQAVVSSNIATTNTTTASTTVVPTTSTPTHNVSLTAKDASGSICALIIGTFEIQMNYSSIYGTMESKSFFIDQPFKYQNGTCQNLTETVVVSFSPLDWQLSFQFSRESMKSDTSYVLKQTNLVAKLDKPYFNVSKPITESYSSNDAPWPTNNLGRPYSCMDGGTIILGNATLMMTEVRLQAFKTNADASFTGDWYECATDSGSNIVPIIVGVCLAVLVIIVLVAFFVTRRKRDSESSYQTV